MPIRIFIYDDSSQRRESLKALLELSDNYVCVGEAPNCVHASQEMEEYYPEVVLMDINMPIKNGIETTAELSRIFPNLKVIALTMEDNESTIIKMLTAGAKGYLLKDMSPDILFDAINIVHEKGIFYTDLVTQSLLKIKSEEKIMGELNESLKDREVEFIKLACSELTYKDIAEEMCLSPRTIDGYRDSVFVKLNVKTRVGIVLFAIKHNII